MKLSDCDLLDDSRRLNKVSVDLEVEYEGGFQLAIDAITKQLSQKAVVKIKSINFLILLI